VTGRRVGPERCAFGPGVDDHAGGGNATAGNDMRVLIVADDAALADLIKLSLRCGFYEKGKRLARTGGRITDGLEVEHVLRPEDALRFLAETSEHVDVILADLQADPRDGLGFLETCRGQYRDKYGEIIALAERRRS